GRVNATLATALRAVIMAAVLLAVAAAGGHLQALWRGTGQLDARAWLFLTLAGVCGAVSWLAYFAALQLGLASRVAALDRLSIAWVFLLGVVVLGERHGWRGWLGL